MIALELVHVCERVAEMELLGLAVRAEQSDEDVGVRAGLLLVAREHVHVVSLGCAQCHEKVFNSILSS